MSDSSSSPNPSPSTPSRSVAVRLACALLPATLLTGLGILFFPAAGRDDSHITYWSAYALSSFGEILNYNGDRVEQSSSLLHVLVLALAHTVSGVDVVTLGRVLSVVCGVLTLYLVQRLGDRILEGVGLPAALLTGTSVFFVYWSFGGLESSLASLLVVGLILSWDRHLAHPSRGSLALAAGTTLLMTMVRPEMPIVLICMILGVAALFAIRRLTLSRPPASAATSETSVAALPRLAALAVTGLLGCAVVFAFRLAYFGSLFPQPVTAKSGDLSWHRIAGGLRYLGPSSLFSSPFVLPFCVLCVGGSLFAAWHVVRCEKPRPAVMLSLTFVTAYVSFIVLTGGDWMEGGRMLAHALPVASILAAFALRSVLRSWNVRATLMALACGLQLVFFWEWTATRSVGMPLWTSLEQYDAFGEDFGASSYTFFDRTNRDHLRNIPTIRHVGSLVDQLLEGDRDRVQILAHQMGVLPFHLARSHFERVRFFDVNGLTDRVATDSPAFSRMAHTIYGVVGVMIHCIENPSIFRAHPDVPRPDLIVYQFYRQGPRRAWFDAGGYEVVYVQRGRIDSGSKHLPGHMIHANQLIAVRKDLLPEIRMLPEPRLDFRDAGVVQPESAW